MEEKKVLYKIKCVHGWKGSGHTMYTRNINTVQKYEMLNKHQVIKNSNGEVYKISVVEGK